MSNFRLVGDPEPGLNPDCNDLALDEQCQLVFLRCGQDEQTDQEIIAQALRSRFMFSKGEWFLDLDEGLPWLERIIRKQPDLTVIEDVFREVITDTRGVASVKSIGIDFDRGARKLTIKFQAVTDRGQLVTEENLGRFVIGI